MRIITLLLLITIVVNVKGWFFNDLKLKDISGTWKASYRIPAILFPETDSISAVNLCREDLSEACDNSLPNGEDIFEVDADSNTFSTLLTIYPLATSEQASIDNYPECAEEGVILRASQFTSNGPIISFENGKFTFENDGNNNCFSWKVFYKDNEVKAFIYQFVNFTLPYELLPSRPPFECRESKDSFFSKMNRFKDSIRDKWSFSTSSSLNNRYFPRFKKLLNDEEVECFVEAGPTELTLRFELNFTTTCVDGPCLDLANKFKLTDGWLN